jgi:hypothetical protein
MKSISSAQLTVYKKYILTSLISWMTHLKKFISLFVLFTPQALQAGCDKWAPGIEIIAVRVTKPRIP